MGAPVNYRDKVNKNKSIVDEIFKADKKPEVSDRSRDKKEEN